MTTMHGLAWVAIPFQPIRRAATILGTNEFTVRKRLDEGQLEAVELGGQVMITTESIIDYFAKAKPWESARRQGKHTYDWRKPERHVDEHS